ncbi:hypothetical protein GQ600_3922 [Phytophthora cactorum]|nr:hypothetical protein GQ600_3922 [Phytophthora cactorum]
MRRLPRRILTKQKAAREISQDEGPISDEMRIDNGVKWSEQPYATRSGAESKTCALEEAKD